MLSLKQLKEERIIDMVCRMHDAMRENYFGGDTLIVKNYELKQKEDEYGNKLKPKIEKQYFTANELEFIEREKVLDKIREDGWKIDIQRPEDGEFVEIEWFFTGGGEIKLF